MRAPAPQRAATPTAAGCTGSACCRCDPSSACACTAPRCSAACSARRRRSMLQRPSTAASLQPAGLVSRLPHAAAALGPHLGPFNLRDDPLLGKRAGAAVPTCRTCSGLRSLRAPRPAAAGCTNRHAEPSHMADEIQAASSGLLKQPAHERRSASSDAAKQAPRAG